MRSISKATIIKTAIIAVLAVAAPASVRAADTTLSSTLGSVLSVFTTSGSVSLNVTPSAVGAQTIASDTVTISTNGPGYTLNLSDKDTNTNLVSGGNNIPANGGTQASPTALTANKWGYRVDTVGGFGTGPTSAISSSAISALTFAGVPSSASPNLLRSTVVPATNDQTLVWYSVAANTSQPAGSYSDIVTYTAVSN